MKNLQCSFFKIATCEAFLKNTKILSFSKIKSKSMHHSKKQKQETFFFHILHLSSKFQCFSFNEKNSKTKSVPLIDNTNELIRKFFF